MRSTGEVMGVGANFGEAFAKAQISAGTPLPEKGTVFISVNEHHKPEAVGGGAQVRGAGVPACGHARHGRGAARGGLACKIVFKVNEGRPNAVDLLKAGSIQLAFTRRRARPRSSTRRPSGAAR
jgi:carbamoyl-phosphate synthase large subunit